LPCAPLAFPPLIEKESGTMVQHILALPLVAKVIALLGVAALGVLGWAKHKAITEVSGAATKATESKLLGWFGRKLYAAAPPPTVASAKPHNERTYRGTFVIYAKRMTYSQDHFFEIEHEGTAHTVPVKGTHLLADLQPGTFVEIDTLVGQVYFVEVVQRVRVFKAKAKPRGPLAQGPAGY